MLSIPNIYLHPRFRERDFVVLLQLRDSDSVRGGDPRLGDVMDACLYRTDLYIRSQGPLSGCCAKFPGGNYKRALAFSFTIILISHYIVVENVSGFRAYFDRHLVDFTRLL